MNYDLLVFLLCAEFSIIVVLVIFLSRKRKVITEYEDEKRKQKLHYYSLQSSLDKYRKQIQAIKDYNTELEKLNKTKERLLSVQKKILQQNEDLSFKERYIEKIYDFEKNFHLFQKISGAIGKTNDIAILQTEYKSGLEAIQQIIYESSNYPNINDLLEGKADDLLNSFREQYNNIILRIAEYHLLRYQQKFYELYTSTAKLNHTQKIFFLLDTLYEMVEVCAPNTDCTLEKLKEYHDNVEEIYSGMYNY
ncbi:MAG: hypothetical protein LBL13_07705 [Bacteroidales bacterium]|jgi:hypothetical protein|nr:hypothetical protein [Bacteroidales bacterium]